MSEDNDCLCCCTHNTRSIKSQFKTTESPIDQNLRRSKENLNFEYDNYLNDCKQRHKDLEQQVAYLIQENT